MRLIIAGGRNYRLTDSQWSAVEAAVHRKSIHKRKTTLARRLDEAIENTPRPGDVAADSRPGRARGGARWRRARGNTST